MHTAISEKIKVIRFSSTAIKPKDMTNQDIVMQEVLHLPLSSSNVYLGIIKKKNTS